MSAAVEADPFSIATSFDAQATRNCFAYSRWRLRHAIHQIVLVRMGLFVRCKEDAAVNMTGVDEWRLCRLRSPLRSYGETAPRYAPNSTCTCSPPVLNPLDSALGSIQPLVARMSIFLDLLLCFSDFRLQTSDF